MSGKMKAVAAACLCALAFLSPQAGGAEKAQGPARAPASKALKDLPPPDPALFRIVNGKSTVYLLGSIHILPVNFWWRSPAIDQAIASADAFMFETNLDYETSEFDYYRDHHGYLPPGHTIHEMLSPDALKQYTTMIRELHIDPNKIDYLQPGLAVFVLNNIQHSIHTEYQPGVDAALVSYAKHHGKQLGFLEPLELQFEVLTKIGGGGQVKVLEKALTDLDTSHGKFQTMLAAWAKGDLAELQALDDFKDPEVRTVLLDKRNASWIPRIQSILDVPQTTLITVGAAHLAGKGSVIDLLCAKHWKVERIKAGVASSACGA